jgi:hypothetical protein
MIDELDGFLDAAPAAEEEQPLPDLNFEPGNDLPDLNLQEEI